MWPGGGIALLLWGALVAHIDGIVTLPFELFSFMLFYSWAVAGNIVIHCQDLSFTVLLQE